MCDYLEQCRFHRLVLVVLSGKTVSLYTLFSITLNQDTVFLH